MSLTKEQILFFNKLQVIDLFGLDYPEELYLIPIQYIKSMKAKRYTIYHRPGIVTDPFTGEASMSHTGYYVETTSPSIITIINCWNHYSKILKKNTEYFNLGIRDEFSSEFINAALTAFDINHPDEAYNQGLDAINSQSKLGYTLDARDQYKTQFSVFSPRIVANRKYY